VYTPVVVIVVDGRIAENAEKVLAAAKRFGHDVFLAGLGEDLEVAPVKVDRLDDVTLQADRSNVGSVVDATSRHFLSTWSRKNVLLRSAEILNCSKIFSPECSNDLAVSIIAGSPSRLFCKHIGEQFLNGFSSLDTGKIRT
jgi:hypothetical protein